MVPKVRKIHYFWPVQLEKLGIHDTFLTFVASLKTRLEESRSPFEWATEQLSKELSYIFCWILVVPIPYKRLVDQSPQSFKWKDDPFQSLMARLQFIEFP